MEQQTKLKILNSAVAAGLVFLGGLTANNLSSETMIAAGIAAGVVLLSQFKEIIFSEEQALEKKTIRLLAFF